MTKKNIPIFRQVPIYVCEYHMANYTTLYSGIVPKSRLRHLRGAGISETGLKFCFVSRFFWVVMIL